MKNSIPILSAKNHYLCKDYEYFTPIKRQGVRRIDITI